MATFETISVGDAEAGLRLDRWFRERFPGVTFGQLQKWLRTGQVRVDGKRAKTGVRLEVGQEVRVPPIGHAAPKVAVKPAPKAPKLVAPDEVKLLKERVIFKNQALIALDKPAGLAVQGGTRLDRHLDAMLDALRFDGKERPRLVHRLDRDTSGVLLLARSRVAAQELTRAFRARETRKIYLAITVGCPRPHQGKIDLALAKAGGRGQEKMVADAEAGARAVTLFSVLDHAGQKAALVALMPVTGRTHQLRAHMAAIGTPILGDGKYGGREAYIGAEIGIENRLHLHAARLEIPDAKGKNLRFDAPVPHHFKAALKAFGFDLPREIDLFPRSDA
jgi:23S rRNA pseudouridine955/2504/2580 synthase